MSARSPYSVLKSILLVLNVGLALLIVFSLLASVIPPSSSTFLSVFGLLFPPLMILNILFLISWAVLRSRWWWLPLIILFIGTGQVLNNFQLTLSRQNPAHNEGIKVLTYNVQRFGMDADQSAFNHNRLQVTEFLRERDPDIICLQEYHGRGTTLYEPLQQTREMVNALTYYYESYFNPRYQQLSGLAIFTKFRAINKGKLKFEGSRTFGIYADVVHSSDTIRIYNIHLASIQLQDSDIDFVVNPGQNQNEMGLHAMHIYSKLTDSYLLRERQMQHLLDELEECPYPVILSGDFNDTPSSYNYRQITRLLDDTFIDKGSGFGITYAGRLPFLRIDYLMKSGEFRTIRYVRHRVAFSDHYPVSAMLVKSK